MIEVIGGWSFQSYPVKDGWCACIEDEAGELVAVSPNFQTETEAEAWLVDQARSQGMLVPVIHDQVSGPSINPGGIHTRG